ncbi:MAG TPA: PaaI family thioesterase [Solirubrobacteraceae bacterium]|nr:PaaI family thioesterase [Solirubrobacteraceae bacterium]
MAESLPEWGAPQTRTVTWYDPQVVRGQLAGLSGQAYLQGMIEGRIPPPPIAEMASSRLVSAGDGEAVFSCRPDESWLNPLGLVHGGLLCTLLDSAMGVAVQSTQPVGTGYATIELKVSFLKPLAYDGTEVEARGRVLRIGRRIAYAEAHAFDGHGALVGHATSSLASVSA